MLCCCAGRQHKVYATEQEAEARVQTVMAARREAKQQQDVRTASAIGNGVETRRHSLQGPASTSGRRASLGSDTRRHSVTKSLTERRGSLSNRRSSNSSADHRGSLSNRRGSNSFAERRGSLSNRRGSVSSSGSGAVLTTKGYGAAAAAAAAAATRRGSGVDVWDTTQSGTEWRATGQSRRRRWSVESRSPLSPVVESPANRLGVPSLVGPEKDDEDLPLIARSHPRSKDRTGALVRTRSGSQPDALSPKMRGTLIKRCQTGRTKKTTMEMLLLMDNININDLHKAGTTLDELMLMGFGPKCLAATRMRDSDGRIVPIFPLREIKQCYKIDRRWLLDQVDMDANLFSRTANSVADYLAVGIDASWLLINGLDAGCMRRFAEYISLSDWVTKLGLEQSIARKIGLRGKDFVGLGWDYESLVKSLDYTAQQLEALGIQEDSVNKGFAGKAGRRTHMARKQLDQAERTREALLKESLPTPSALPARRASIVGAGRRRSRQRDPR